MLTALVALAIVIPAAARSRIEKTLKLAPNGRFTLESDVGSVTLTGTSSSGAHVVIDADRDDFESRYTINFEENSGSASVTVRRKDHFSWNEHGSVHFEIEVPSQTQTDVRTGGGSVTVSSLRGESELKTSGGSIDVSGLTGKLDARTSGGSIHLREVTGDTRVDTSGGPIEVDSVDGSLTAHTSGGSIHIDRVSGHVEAKTSGGPISVNFGRGNARGGVSRPPAGPSKQYLTAPLISISMPQLPGATPKATCPFGWSERSPAPAFTARWAPAAKRCASTRAAALFTSNPSEATVRVAGAALVAAPGPIDRPQQVALILPSDCSESPMPKAPWSAVAPAAAISSYSAAAPSLPHSQALRAFSWSALKRCRGRACPTLVR